MKRMLFALVVTCFGASMAASAGENPNLQRISFEDFRTACQNPAKFHNQIAPTNIQVSCKDVQFKWIPDTSASQSLETSRQVTVSVISDKYTADYMTGVVQSDPQSIGCPAYKQVYETVETVRAISCQEIIAFNGTGTEFCTSALNSLKTANPDAITTQATGETINLCAGGTAQQGQGQGQGPKH